MCRVVAAANGTAGDDVGSVNAAADVVTVTDIAGVASATAAVAATGCGIGVATGVFGNGIHTADTAV